MLKKVLLIVMVMIMLLTVAVGCQQDKTDGNTETATDSTTEDSTATVVESSNVNAAGELPIVNEKLKITVMVRQSPRVNDYEDNLLINYLKEQANVELEVIAVPRNDLVQKINLMISSKSDMPDIFMACLNSDIVTTYADDGIFVKLNDYIENESYYFAEEMKDNPDYINGAKLPDGSIYVLPIEVKGEEHYGHGDFGGKMWVNTAWLEALDIEMPETTDEFADMLRAFKTQDPNGNGIADEIPMVGAFTGGWDSLPEIYLLNSFLPYDPKNMYFKEDGVVMASYADEAFREGLQYINMLYEEGLIDSVTYTQDNAQLQQIVENPDAEIVGCVPSGAQGMFVTMGTEREQNFKLIAPVAGPDGVRLTKTRIHSLQNGTFTAITTACEDPLAAFRLLDYFFSDDITLRNKFGVEGTHWESAADGVIGLDGEQALVKELIVLSSGDTHNVTLGNNFGNCSTFINGLAVDDRENSNEAYLRDASYELYAPYVPKYEDYVPNYFYSPEDSKKIGEINQVLQPFVSEYITKFIVGIEDINDDAVWEKYLGELDKIGYQQIVDIIQARADQAG